MSESHSSSSSEEEVVQDDPLRVAFASSGTAERAGPSDMGATAVSEIDTDVQSDAQAQFERVQQILKEGGDDKVYLKFINFFIISRNLKHDYFFFGNPVFRLSFFDLIY